MIQGKTLTISVILKTIGDRLTYCRSAISLTRKELANLWGEASLPTISRWELDYIIPPTKKIASISEFFCTKGLIVTTDWLEKGNGTPPTFLNTKEFNEDEFDAACEQTFFVINQNTKDFVYYKVTSNFFSPIIRYGDYVGGIKIGIENINQYINTLAIVIHENTVHVGFLEYANIISLKNSQGKKMEFQNYSHLAALRWTAIRP